MITLTAKAKEHFRKVLKDHSHGIMVEVKKSGCSGFAYKVSTVESEPEQPCHLSEDEGIRVYVPEQHREFLNNTIIDVSTTMLSSKVTFINPNVVSSCGCGESVSFK